jgi:Ca2+-binding RTX toxin-like protein
MAVVLGTNGSDLIVDTDDGNIIFGDPYTEGNFHGFPGNGAILSSGSGGDDVIDGRDGIDYIVGDAAVMTGNARGGDDCLIGGDGGEFGEEGSFETLIGDADNTMSVNARGGNDRLDGRDGVDYLVGDSFEMLDSTRGGNDHLIGGADTDFLYGDADGLMVDSARGGHDLLEGRSGDDEISGDSGWVGMSDNARGGNDRLDGGSGDDLLVGDGAILAGNAVCGDDVLIGGVGNDRLYGDANPAMSDLTNVRLGEDRFVFANGCGLDTIFDFGNGQDVIDVRGFHGIDRFSQIRAHAGQADTDVVVDLGAAAGHTAGINVLTLAGFALSDLNARDFLFA